MEDYRARYVGGLATTGALLAAGHYFAWWKPLPRLAAYAFGVASILLGQGVFLRFNRQWRALCSFAMIGGGVVTGAHLYDTIARGIVNSRAGARGNDGLSEGTIQGHGC